MTSFEKRVVAACADTMLPSDGSIPVSGTEAGVVAYFESHLRGLDTAQRLLYRLLILFIQLSPLVFGPRRTTFLRLTPVERTRALTEMERCAEYFRRVAIFQSLRFILTIGYFACERVDEMIAPRKHTEVAS
jgi:hypothetical protein